MTTFTFNGTDLSTFGNITVIDEYLDMPERRGDNFVIPHRNGSVFVEKFWSERTISVGIAITGTTLSGLESTLNTLRLLLSPRAQKTLSITFEDASTKTVLASVDKPLEVSRIQTMARVVIEFTMCEPFFRSDTAIADNTETIDSSPHAMTVSNTGSVEERSPTIVLTGPLSNTVITNTTNGVVLAYNGTIVAPRVVTISTINGEFACSDDLANNLIGNVTHSGSSALMVFDVGDNILSITDDTATTGTIAATFYPPFI